MPTSVQSEVLAQSRRRCCICYGLHRDEEIKSGQIAHLDRDRNNNELGNLAFLCLHHHNEYDSRTSQSKGLTRAEVEKYRKELIERFSTWHLNQSRDQLLNFLAFSADLETMADAAVRAAGLIVWYAEPHAFDVLITDAIDYFDLDLLIPHQSVLDHFSAWGWLTYSEEEREVDGETRTFLTVDRKPICDQVAAKILERARKTSKETAERMLYTAKYRGWTEPKEKWR